jgi:hypothetical protein
MAMKKTSGGDSPLRQGVGKSFWSKRECRGEQIVTGQCANSRIETLSSARIASTFVPVSHDLI